MKLRDILKKYSIENVRVWLNGKVVDPSEYMDMEVISIAMDISDVVDVCIQLNDRFVN